MPPRKESVDARKNASARKQDRWLTDNYAAEARKDSLLPGDELSELEPVGRKNTEQRSLKATPAAVAKERSPGRVKLAGSRTSGNGRR